MGLMYPFPVSTDEGDFAHTKDNSLTLKTYGLPYIFWIYAFCSVMVIFFMFLAIKEPVLKLVAVGDEVDAMLGYGLLFFIGALPLFIFTFFFYEKRIVAGLHTLHLEHRIFGIKFFSKKLKLEPQDELSVDSFLTSPNVARAKSTPESQGFENKGYFVLWLKYENGKKILIDRHSRKADLIKLKSLLENVMYARA